MTKQIIHEYLKVKNWSEFQHYKDRSPPWIKLHRDLLRDYEFSCLQDASKLLLIEIWLLASQLDNQVPADAKWLKRQLPFDGNIDLKPLIDSGFLILEQDASKALADRKQSAMPETETEAYKQETETDRFAEWWDAYAKKVDRKRCEAHWSRMQWGKLDITPDSLIADALNRHANDDKWRRGYQPNPLTYLRGERWQDELSKDKDNGARKTNAQRVAESAERYLREIDGGGVDETGPSLPKPVGSIR